jgi:hypothetical protein
MAPRSRPKTVFANVKATSDRTSIWVEAKAAKPTGTAEAVLWRAKEWQSSTPSASLTLRWAGRLSGEPSLWVETWYWRYGEEDPPQDSERLTRNCPNRELIERALEAMHAAIPEDS